MEYHLLVNMLKIHVNFHLEVYGYKVFLFYPMTVCYFFFWLYYVNQNIKAAFGTAPADPTVDLNMQLQVICQSRDDVSLFGVCDMTA